MIKLPVIKFKNSILRTVYWMILVLTTLGFIVLFIFLQDDNNQIGKLFLISMSVFTIGIFFLKKTSSKLGFITISKNEIEYSNNDKNEVYSTKDISEISILYDGYSGKPRTLNVLLSSSGSGNILKFIHKDHEEKFKIKLEFQHLGLLRKVFKEYESIGMSITVLNTWGRKIEL